MNIKFSFPKIYIIKGTNELIAYHISQERYYYLKMDAPLLLEAQVTISNQEMVHKGFFDYGDYLIPIQIYMYPTFWGTSSWNVYKKKLYKSDFPDQKLIAIFDNMLVKYTSKEEDSIVFQFSESIYACGTITKGLSVVVDSDYENGEMIQVIYEGLYFWK